MKTYRPFMVFSKEKYVPEVIGHADLWALAANVAIKDAKMAWNAAESMENDPKRLSYASKIL